MTTTRTAPRSATAIKVDEFTAACADAGFRFTSCNYGGGDYVVEVTTTFAPNDAVAYLKAEHTSYNLLGLAPVVTYGTTWGSDSGSVGGHSALTSGRFHMCKSGVGKRFGAALAKAS